MKFTPTPKTLLPKLEWLLTKMGYLHQRWSPHPAPPYSDPELYHPVLNHTHLAPGERVKIHGRLGRYVGNSWHNNAVIELDHRDPFYSFLGWRSGGLIVVAPFQPLLSTRKPA